jgi:hypothetical protein
VGTIAPTKEAAARSAGLRPGEFRFQLKTSNFKLETQLPGAPASGFRCNISRFNASNSDSIVKELTRQFLPGACAQAQNKKFLSGDMRRYAAICGGF